MQLVFDKTKEKCYYQQIKVKVLIIYSLCSFSFVFPLLLLQERNCYTYLQYQKYRKSCPWDDFSLTLLLQFFVTGSSLHSDHLSSIWNLQNREGLAGLKSGNVQNMDPGPWTPSMGIKIWTRSITVDKVHGPPFKDQVHRPPIFATPKNVVVNNNKIKISKLKK